MKSAFFGIAALLAAAPAWAGRPVATGALEPPSGGIVYCSVSNISTEDSIFVEVSMYRYDGTVIWTTTATEVHPTRSWQTSPGGNQMSFCVATVVSGPKKALRLAISAENSAGALVTSLPAN